MKVQRWGAERAKTGLQSDIFLTRFLSIRRRLTETATFIYDRAKCTLTAFIHGGTLNFGCMVIYYTSKGYILRTDL